MLGQDFFINAMCALWFACCGASAFAAENAVEFPAVDGERKLEFPHDHGAHPEYRTEWWYVTGWVEHDGIERGFQVTFFRSRTGLQEDNESGFAPRQLIFAHAAIADAEHGQLRHDQRAAREGFDLAYAKAGETNVAIHDWKLNRADGVYHARIDARDFAMDLRLEQTQPLLLQGHSGYSRKGPARSQASYYYSVPQLRVSGSIEIDGTTLPVSGEAWLDHEWSSEYLSTDAQGWDWVSINLHDGAALMAFRMRARDGTTLWAGGSTRDKDGKRTVFEPADVEFKPRSQWRSPRTDIDYPITMRVRAGQYEFEMEPLMADQELDSRASTRIIYWEGAVRATSNGKQIGRGYLELTGYGGRPEM